MQANLPTHIAIIPDGNRRWASAHGLPKIEGHRRGFHAVTKLARTIRRLGIRTFTVWGFSTENWNREKSEIDYLMNIYERWIDENLKDAIKDEVRIVHLGRKDRLPKSLIKKIEDAEKKTKEFSKYYLATALDYGGQDEIVRAVEAARSKLNGKKLTIEEFNKFLDTKDLPQPYPDLIIRTSGEQRTSGFLPWQSAYAEYIFSPKYLPEFTSKDLEKCINEYSSRQRRFGK